MHPLLEYGLSNAVAAAFLALVAAGVGCVCRKPALLHALWLLVLVKLVTPPLFRIDLPVSGPAPALALPEAPVVETSSPSQQLPADRVAASVWGVDPSEPSSSLSTSPTVVGEPLRASEPPTPVATPASLTVEGIASGAAVERLPEPAEALALQPMLLSAWLLGSTAWVLLVGVRLRRFQIMLRRVWLAGRDEQERLYLLASRIGLRHAPKLWLAPAAIAPMLYALPGVARLLVPAALWERLSGEQRDALLLHELAHLKRKDHWVRWLEIVVLGLFFWHPAAWWAQRRLTELEEELADAWVVWASPREAYAETLLVAVWFLSEFRPALPRLIAQISQPVSGFGHVHSLRRRLKMIVRDNPARRLGLAGVLAMLGVWVVGLSLSPALAQRPSGDDSPNPDPAAAPARNRRTQSVPADEGTVGRYPSRNAQNFANEAQESPESVDRRAFRKATAGERQELADEVALLRLQLELRQAETEETKALVEQARRHIARTERLAKSGTLTEGEVDQARTDELVRMARLKAKEIAVRETELRLQQATRRLAAMPEEKTRADIIFKDGPYERAGSNAPPGDARFERLERKLDELAREVSALRQELKRPGGTDPFGTPRKPGQSR